VHALHPRRSERRPDQILTFSSVGHFCANLQANGEPRCRLCPPGSPGGAVCSSRCVSAGLRCRRRRRRGK